MKQDTRPLYQPPPQREPLRFLGLILSGVLLAWLMVVLYALAFIIHAIAGAL